MGKKLRMAPVKHARSKGASRHLGRHHNAVGFSPKQEALEELPPSGKPAGSMYAKLFPGDEVEG